jgi:hypothetical protein
MTFVISTHLHNHTSVANVFSRSQPAGQRTPRRGEGEETFPVAPAAIQKRTRHVQDRPPFEPVAFPVQCGGAGGAHQAGAYEPQPEAGCGPDSAASVSIGAANSLRIVGNPPEGRGKGCASSGGA